MTLQHIHKKIVTKRTTLVFTIIVFIFSRFLRINEDNGLILGSMTLIQVGISLVLLYLSNSFVSTRNRTLLPPVFYLVFVGSGISLYEEWENIIPEICILFCLFFLFDSYRQLYSQGSSLNIALVLTVGSFFWEPLLFFFPVFWYGMYKFHILNFRSFFAGLTGIIVVYLFVLTWSFHVGDNFDYFLGKLPKWGELIEIQPFQFSVREYLIGGYLGLIFIVSGINIFISRISDKIKVLAALSFLYFICFISFVGLVLQPMEKSAWFSVLCLSLSFLASDLLTVADNEATNWMLVVSLLFFFGMCFL
jgi:hypothetical protein